MKQNAFYFMKQLKTSKLTFHMNPTIFI